MLKRFNNDHFLGRMNHHFRAVLAKKISICPRAQKIQLCNIFRGRMDNYLGAIMALIRD